MRGKISTGIWFIFFGLIALLHNFNIINFNFWAILPYWPLLIIAVGAKLIFQNNKNGLYIIPAINIILCLFLGYIGLTSNEKFNLMDKIMVNSNPKDTIGASMTVHASPYLGHTETATLVLNTGALALRLDSIPSEELVVASTDNNNIGLKLLESGDNESPNFELNTVIKKEGKNNSVTLALNENPIWDIYINMGAATFNADLSRHKFSNMEINAGAASMNLTFGMPSVENSTVEVNTGASSFVINIPKEAACQVEISSFLSSKKLNGFDKNGNYYQTPDFENAEKKYTIHIEGAANSLKINRY